METNSSKSFLGTSTDIGVPFIAVANHKGGVGKTTTTLNVAADLALFYGKKVLVMDMDKQAHCAFFSGLERREGIEKLFSANYKQVVLSELVQKIDLTDNLCIDLLGNIGSHGRGLERVERAMVKNDDRDNIYDLVINLIKAHRYFFGQYDVVLIDCPPGVTMITKNIYRFADYIIIPTSAHESSFDGIDQLVREVARYSGKVKSKVMGFVLTREKPHSAVRSTILKFSEGLLRAKSLQMRIPVIGYIPESARVEEATTKSLGTCPSLAVYAPKSKPAVAYEALTDNVAKMFGWKKQSKRGGK